LYLDIAWEALNSMSFSEICDLSIKNLDILSDESKGILADASVALQNINYVDVPANKPANMILPVFYGGLGAFISTNKAFNNMFRKVHDEWQVKGGIKGLLTDHQNEAIDQITTGTFTDRIGNKSPIRLHRVFWGHDIFSLKSDNPFTLSVNQHGFVIGIVKAIRHLLTDSFSKQGLPIPFHSSFDYVNSAGNLSNRLVDFARKQSVDAGTSMYTTFDQLFTIKASDIATTGLTSACCIAHNRIFNRDDEEAAIQTRLIAYSSLFFSKAIIGIIQTGIPFLSWPAALMTAKELIQLYRISWVNIKKLEKITETLIEKTKSIEDQVFSSGKNLISYSDPMSYINEISNFDKSLDGLCDFFET